MLSINENIWWHLNRRPLELSSTKSQLTSTLEDHNKDFFLSKLSELKRFLWIKDESLFDHHFKNLIVNSLFFLDDPDIANDPDCLDTINQECSIFMNIYNKILNRIDTPAKKLAFCEELKKSKQKLIRWYQPADYIENALAMAA